MPTVADILASKGANIYSIEASATVLEATKAMNNHRIGSLVVTEQGEAAGIITERDVLTRVVAQEREPSRTLVGDVMTRDLICCPPETDLDEVGAIMRSQRIRHVPVCTEEGKLVGLISIGDINAHNARNQEATITFLSDYIYGRV